MESNSKPELTSLPEKESQPATIQKKIVTWPSVLIVFCCFAIIFTIGFLSAQRLLLTKPQLPSSPTDILLVDTSRSSQHYTNTKYGYAISIPANWRIERSGEEFDSESEIASFYRLADDIVLATIKIHHRNSAQPFSPETQSLLGNVTATQSEQEKTNSGVRQTYAIATSQDSHLEISVWYSSQETIEQEVRDVLTSFTLDPKANAKQSDDSSISRTVIPLAATDTWKTVSANNVQFKLPRDYRTEQNPGTDLVLVYAPGSLVPFWIRIEQYQGGSRREQALKGLPAKECGYIFEEALFGNRSVLQIAGNPEECQGGYLGGRVVVIGQKLVTVVGLTYDPPTKAIVRDEILDTITATLAPVGN